MADLQKRKNETQKSLQTQSPIQHECEPLALLIARARTRWPYPEMSDLERADWMETLNLYPLTEVAEALNEIMLHPPADHEGNEYRGRPSLVDVTRTIQIARENKAIKAQQAKGDLTLAEMAELKKRRDAGEEFFGEADLAKHIRELFKMDTPAKSDAAMNDAANKLEKQKAELLGK